MHVQPEVHLHQVWKESTAHCKALTVIQKVSQNGVLWSVGVTAAEKGLEAVSKLSFGGELWVHRTNDTTGTVRVGGGGRGMVPGWEESTVLSLMNTSAQYLLVRNLQ